MACGDSGSIVHIKVDKWDGSAYNRVVPAFSQVIRPCDNRALLKKWSTEKTFMAHSNNGKFKSVDVFFTDLCDNCKVAIRELRYTCPYN
jgi:hypothetical protein